MLEIPSLTSTIDPPQLTRQIEYYKIRNKLDIPNFFSFIEQHVSFFTPPNWGVFAKKIHQLSKKSFILKEYQSRIETILSYLIPRKESLSSGQVAQLLGSTFTFCTIPSEIGTSFLNLFEKNVSSFNEKEFSMALRGIQRHPESILIVQLLFDKIDKKAPNCDLLAFVTLLARRVGAVPLAERLEPLIVSQIGQLTTQRLIDVIEEMGHYVRESVFFNRQTMQSLFDELLERLTNCNNKELVQKGIFVGSEILSLYYLKHSKWISFCLTEIHFLQVWDKIALLNYLAQLKNLPQEFQKCLIQVIKEYQSTPPHRVNKYPEDGLLLAHLAGQYCKEERALISKLLNFVSSHMQTSNS